MHHNTGGHSPAPSISIVSGNDQYAVPGVAFAHPLVVKVLDADSFPVRDTTQVTFTIAPISDLPAGTAVFVDGQIRATAGTHPGNGHAISPPIIARQPGPIQVTAELIDAALAPKVAFDLDVIDIVGPAEIGDASAVLLSACSTKCRATGCRTGARQQRKNIPS